MFSVPLSIEPGTIALWAGRLSGVPPGWTLCNGANGTPNLLDKFVIATGPLFAVGNEGGGVTHTHPMDSDDHDHHLTPNAFYQTGTDRSTLLEPQYVTGTSDAASSIPIFYEIAYIMKL